MKKPRLWRRNLQLSPHLLRKKPTEQKKKHLDVADAKLRRHPKPKRRNLLVPNEPNPMWTLRLVFLEVVYIEQNYMI